MYRDISPPMVVVFAARSAASPSRRNTGGDLDRRDEVPSHDGSLPERAHHPDGGEHVPPDVLEGRPAPAPDYVGGISFHTARSATDSVVTSYTPAASMSASIDADAWISAACSSSQRVRPPLRRASAVSSRWAL